MNTPSLPPLDEKRRRGPIAWMASNPVSSNILMLLLLIGGWFSALRIKQEYLPETQLDMVQISIPYPGASPDEVEQGILLAVEEAVRGINGVKKVTSVANEGIASVMVEVLPSYDVNRVTDDVRNEVDRIRTMPQDAEEPIIQAIKVKASVLDLVVAAQVPRATLREIAERVRDRLLQSKDITQISFVNVRRHEISVEIPQEKLRELGLTLDQVARIIRQSSLELPGGGIRTQRGEILVRVKDRRDLGREFAQIPIVATDDGSRLLLGDIASIRDGFDESDRFTFHNGKPAVSMTVYRVGKQTPISVEKAVKKIIKELEATMPDGVEFALLDNRADMFRGRMNLMLKNGAMGLVLVFVLLGLFLELRLAFWVMLGIPVSFLGTFIFMGQVDTSLNMITMFAFLIALGIVVDDAIVVGENIYHHHQSGMPFHLAAIRGAQEIAVPVTFSILTNIIAFLPLYFVPGALGKFFKHIPMVVCATFAISLIEALYILPAHLGHQRENARTNPLHKLQQRFSKRFVRFVEEGYGPFLEHVLHQRYLVISIGIAVLILTLGYVKSGRMGFELFPTIESDNAQCTFILPYGSPVERTLSVRDRVLEAGLQTAREIEKESGKKLLKGTLSTIGTGGFGGIENNGPAGGHVGEVNIEFFTNKERPVSTSEFVERWRKATGSIGGLKSIRFRDDSGSPGGGNPALSVELSHRDMNVLEEAAHEVAQRLASYSMVRDIDDGFTPGKPQIDLSINDRGRAIGLSAADIARQLRNSYYGAEAIRQQRGRNEIKIMVRLPRTERDTQASLENMIVRAPSGQEVPLREVVNMRRGRAYTSITRREGRRIVTVTADVVPRDQTPQMLAALRKTILPEIIKKHPGLTYSFEGREADRRESVSGLRRGLMLALLMIYVLLAIPFKSYGQPLIIMTAIPFGIVGAVLGHLFLGYSLCILSLFGVVALSGVVVNDSLVLIDFANRKRLEGLSMHDAICSAGIQRFRPIVLTTLTTFFGLMPMMFEQSRQARFLIPMAISLGFGILFATFITLVLIPALTLALEDLSLILKRIFR